MFDNMITGAHQEKTRVASDAVAVPSAWPRYARTRDGVEYRIRPIRADDRERDRAFIAGLSTQSRYSRMMGLMREPSAELLDRLVRVDYRREMALVRNTADGQQANVETGGRSAHERASLVRGQLYRRGLAHALAR